MRKWLCLLLGSIEIMYVMPEAVPGDACIDQRCPPDLL